MKQKYLSKWLKMITIITGVIIGVIYFLFIPFMGKDLVNISSKIEYEYWPWLILIWLTSIPCYIALVLFYRICIEIGNDNSFSEKNAKLLKEISWLAIIDSLLFFIGSIGFSLVWGSNLLVIAGSLIVVFAGLAMGIIAAALSHMVLKASRIKDENDLTI